MTHNHINYLYFGAIFSLLVFITAGSIFTKENLGGSQFFFFLYALGQVVLETALYIFLGSFIRKLLGKLCFALFIGATFFLVLIHAFDFLLDRILDLSTWEALNVFVLAESFDNFLLLLEASGIPLWGWVGIFATIAAIPLLGIFLYKLCEVAIQKKPVLLRHSYFLQAFLCIPCALLFWDFSASKVIHPDAYTAFIKSLPWKFTFLHPDSVSLNLGKPLHKPLPEEQVLAAIDETPVILHQKPNIYLFVVESLRADSITAEIAPHLYEFKTTYHEFDWAISNGNGTHISWFSLFHSQFPYFWASAQKNWKSGSPALHLLKKWGYQIRLYTSAHLSYYGMDKLLFGEKLELIDEQKTFHHIPPASAADTDAAALAQLQKDLENPEMQEGQVFLIFWDTTHFDYSWPKDWAPRFLPFAKELAYFKAFQSQKTIGQIKNRYYNAVNYMDSLFGKFINELPRKEEAIVVFTGDHGEEFFEHGHLFHNSHLTQEQTHIPLYFKFGSGEKSLIERPLVSQMDVFPSLIDYLSGHTPSFLEGNSLFQKPIWPYAITARFNAGLTPYEFCIHNGTHKLIARFPDFRELFRSHQLQILSLRTERDKTVHDCKNNVEGWIRGEFGPALNRLFD